MYACGMSVKFPCSWPAQSWKVGRRGSRDWTWAKKKGQEVSVEQAWKLARAGSIKKSLCGMLTSCGPQSNSWILLVDEVHRMVAVHPVWNFNEVFLRGLIELHCRGLGHYYSTLKVTSSIHLHQFLNPALFTPGKLFQKEAQFTSTKPQDTTLGTQCGH